MKPLKPVKKLQINKDTLRKLTDEELSKIGGGAGNFTLWCSTTTDDKCPGGFTKYKCL